MSKQKGARALTSLSCLASSRNKGATTIPILQERVRHKRNRYCPGEAFGARYPSPYHTPTSARYNTARPHHQGDAAQKHKDVEAQKSPLPLHGITVISLEQAIAGPYCTRQLADLGARVIKIERPDVGDFARHLDDRVNGMSSQFVWSNRSKESLELDVKTPRGLAILKKLLSMADVFVQNLAPGAARRLGLSFEQLHEIYPSLIVCDISGYGSDVGLGSATSHDSAVHGESDRALSDTDSYYTKKAYDLLIQSEAGLLSITGTPETPAKAGISIADIAAGTHAYSSILAALIARSQGRPQNSDKSSPDKGKGSHIDISMLESMVEWMQFPLYYAYNGSPAPRRTGSEHAAIYPYGPFPTGTGSSNSAPSQDADSNTSKYQPSPPPPPSSVLFGIQNHREWLSLCTSVLHLPTLPTDPRFTTNALRVTNRVALREIIVRVFSQLSARQVVERLDGARIANASVNDMQGVWNHPQLEAGGGGARVARGGGGG